MALTEAPWGCTSDEDCLFARGFVDAGGPLQYLRHLLEDVRPCEGNFGVAYANGYVSAFQFTPGTWAAMARKTGLWDPLNPYDVGANVAALIVELERSGVSPGSSGGWPVCFWRGSIP